MRFAMPKQTPKGLWRRVPPAVFPAILGAMGLALAWRLAAGVFALPVGLAEALAGAMVALFGFAALAYGGKIARRPAVLAEELKILPGRSGVAAAVLCVYLLAGLIGLYLPGVARAVLVVGLGLHVITLAVLVDVLRRGPVEARHVTPVWHLNWVGFIVVARVAVIIGWDGLAAVILWPALAAALLIWAVSAQQLSRALPPAPLRPLLAIHVAPAALLATVALALGIDWLGEALSWGALLLLLVLGLRAGWLLQAGFSPMWGALSFPLSATAGLWLLRVAQSGGALDRLIAAVLLVGASMAVLVILFMVLRDWARGRLAVKTNAAIA